MDSALHIMMILQAYQAHFKRDLNEGTAVDGEAIGAADLALRATKLEERSKIPFTALLVQYWVLYRRILEQIHFDT